MNELTLDVNNYCITKDELNLVKVNNKNYVVYDPLVRHSKNYNLLLSNYIFLGYKIITPWELYEIKNKKVIANYIDAQYLYKKIKINQSYMKIKRILDLSFIIIMLPIFLVLIMTIIFILKFFTKGQIFFKQKRVGTDGKIFKIFKFCTMNNSLSSRNETLSKNDPRITKIGKILRKFRLDELPQVINVLKGDMSFIGPRPETVELTIRYNREISCYNIRTKVKPGITGWAQINQGYSVGVSGSCEKITYDLYYIKHLSFLLDVKIFFKTIKVVLTGKGAV